jgi:voltage-gated potassium channel Kch
MPAVWALRKHYPHVRTYVRARDVEHGLSLEKAGATAVVPETLEPSLQLAAAVMQEMNFPMADVEGIIGEYRRSHIKVRKHSLQ